MHYKGPTSMEVLESDFFFSFFGTDVSVSFVFTRTNVCMLHKFICVLTLPASSFHSSTEKHLFSYLFITRLGM